MSAAAAGVFLTVVDTPIHITERPASAVVAAIVN
jgi:hypothetical protein